VAHQNQQVHQKLNHERAFQKVVRELVLVRLFKQNNQELHRLVSQRARRLWTEKLPVKLH
jgi:hypothetical protein